ncbi:tyrosine-type recombinase/integrase [Burkholderia gladioli]|uniref:tyrosine-type recombinase/integrase n=1 Tax=Burkholderia gladioli TaxID=28095 RepID=UPI0016421B85|nr:site-specific integrase [Burkholderia gladioli]
MPTSKGSAGKIPFTEKTVQAIARLPFDVRPVGVDDGGALITAPVAATVLDYFVRDARQPGFALRLTRAGARTWYAERKLAGRVCRFKCGDFATTSLTKAKDKAVLALAQMDQGIDPNHIVRDALRKTQERHERDKLTFGAMLTRDAERRSAEKAAEGKGDTKNTARDRQNTINVVMKQPIWSKPVTDVTAGDLATLIEAVRKKHKDATAIKVWRYSRAAFGRLASSEMPSVHPFDEFLKSHDAALPKPKRSQRYLPTNEESGVAWLRFIAAQRNSETAVKTGHPWTRAVMADAIITTLCLGFRKMEALALRVEDVNFDKRWIRVTEERAKNKRVHYAPLCLGLEALLRDRIAANAVPRGRDVELAKRGVPIPISPYVFPTERRTAKSGHVTGVQSLLDLASEQAGTYVSMHDLRRTYGGEMYSLIVGGDTGGRADTRLVKQALNHVDEQAREITLSYVNLDARINALRPAAEAHERKIFTLCGLPIPSAAPVSATDAAALLDALKSWATDDPAVLEQLRALLIAPRT